MNEIPIREFAVNNNPRQRLANYTAVNMNTAQQSSAEPDTITDDLCCAACGYSLRTLSVSAICPECARPVRRSIVPPDLNFVSWRAIRRTRLGIAVWVAGLALPAVGIILFMAATWISPAFWEDLSDERSLFSRIYRAALYARVYSASATTCVTALGIILITVSFVKRPHRLRPRLGILTATLAAASIATVLVLRYPALQTPISPAACKMNVAIFLIGEAAGSLAAPLCWILLISRLVVNKSHALGFAMRCALAAPMLLMAGTLAIWAMWAFEPATWVLNGMSYLADDRLEWYDSAWRITRLWEKYGVSTCSILMILALWAYVRRLNSALRSDAMGEGALRFQGRGTDQSVDRN